MGDRPRFGLGAGVSFTHRTGVIRKNRKPVEGYPEWSIVEGLYKGETFDNAINPCVGYEHPRHDENKGIISWPQEGTGIVIGWIKKGIGTSYSSQGVSNTFEDNYEQGYFTANTWVWLYVIKQGLPGVEHIYALPEHVRLINAH